MSTSFPSARRVLLWCLALLLPACTDPYFPEAISTPPSYLVVDGFINTQGVTTIRLSRTYAIASGAAPPAETRATVYIEDEANIRIVLRESVAGTYASATPAVLSVGRKYRLHINTQGGKEYVSDYVAAKTTPPIDDVTWRTDNAGLNIYVNTHDATNATLYYRWEYDETWEIVPLYSPSVEYVGGQIRDIVMPYPSICWSTAHSTTVQIDKTTALTQDVVANFRLRQLPFNSDLLCSRYSILVKQHALTREEYAYWELLRKNTESIGSLFDPQPAQLTSNIHCISNASDIVLGFIGVHSLTEKRIFISRLDLPSAWSPTSPYQECLPADSVSLRPDVRPPIPIASLLQTFFSGPNYLPIEPYYNGITVLGYTAKSRDCIDCRTRGTSIKPSYWP
jgi:hypothetical protein